MRIILDTNFLLIPFTKGIDIFSEIDRIMMEPYEICIVEGTVDELKKIADEQSGRYSRAARMAMELVDKCTILKQKDLYMTGVSSSVDDVLVSLSDADTIIATQDKELKSRLKHKPILTTHGKKLEIKDVL